MKTTSEKIIEDLSLVAGKMVALKKICKNSSDTANMSVCNNDKILAKLPKEMVADLKESAEKHLQECWDKVKALYDKWQSDECPEEFEE